MIDKLYLEIDKFDKWAQQHYDIPQDDIRGEWECNYKNWGTIHKAFQEYIGITDPERWTEDQKIKLLYIIARDNEIECLVDLLDEHALTILTEFSIKHGHRDDKWQLAIQLHKLSDRQKALTLLEKLVNDEDEYVIRRSLMELADLQSDKVEYYVDKFWNKNKYGDMEEYQRKAVLYSLKTIHSELLDTYIELAKQDGRKYLVQDAIRIEAEKNTLSKI